MCIFQKINGIERLNLINTGKKVTPISHPNSNLGESTSLVKLILTAFQPLKRKTQEYVLKATEGAGHVARAT